MGTLQDKIHWLLMCPFFVFLGRFGREPTFLLVVAALLLIGLSTYSTERQVARKIWLQRHFHWVDNDKTFLPTIVMVTTSLATFLGALEGGALPGAAYGVAFGLVLGGLYYAFHWVGKKTSTKPPRP